MLLSLKGAISFKVKVRQHRSMGGGGFSFVAQ